MSDTEGKIRRKFNKGCVDYGLLEDDDRILVGLSGGKDSFMLAELLAARARIFRPNIRVEAAHVVTDNILSLPYPINTTWPQSKECCFGLRRIMYESGIADC